MALSLIQGAACPRLSRGQCPARYGAASVSREEVRRIMLEGLEEGGRVLSPRYKAKVFIKKKSSGGKEETKCYYTLSNKVLITQLTVDSKWLYTVISLTRCVLK